MVVGVSAVARGQSLHRRLDQLEHTAWSTRDGAPGEIYAIEQTSDGYLWLGTGSGLFRFDGLRFERIDVDSGVVSSSPGVSSLLAMPDGSLWIGYSKGGATLLNGRRSSHFGIQSGMPVGTVTSFSRDSAGRVWLSTTRGLARFAGNLWQQAGVEAGYLGGPTASLKVDRRGTLWAAGLRGVCTLAEGATRFELWAPPLSSSPQEAGTGVFAEAPDGSIWGAGMDRGLTRLADQKGGRVQDTNRSYGGGGWEGLLIDDESNAWRLGLPGSLVRIPLFPQPSTRRAEARVGSPERLLISRKAGMSGAQLYVGHVDREGNIWLGGAGGLDRFRATKVTGTPFPEPTAFPIIIAQPDGRIWAAGTRSGQYETDGISTTQRAKIPEPPLFARREPDGTEWIAGKRIWSIDAGRSVELKLPDAAQGGNVRAIARGRADDLWLSMIYRGVFRRHDARWTQFVPAPDLLTATAIERDQSGIVWLAYMEKRIVRVDGDAIRVFAAGDGLNIGAALTLLAHRDHLWVGGEDGIARVDGTHVVSLRVAGEKLRGISGIIETDTGDLWLNGADGITHVVASEVRRAHADSTYQIQVERFDFRDGVEGPSMGLGPNPSAIEGTDGRLWFSSTAGVSWIDPRRVKRNLLPPPVHVRGVTAGSKEYSVTGPDTLPPRTSSLNITYTALSLGVPERIRFRYRLIGNDTSWIEAGRRREAIYTNLRPGHYRFRVIATNDDGVWNADGATVDFVVLPTFAQTNAFIALWTILALLCVCALVVWRQRRVAAVLRARFDATLTERTRIAQELHDTLIQGFTGVTLQVHAAQTMLRGENDSASTLLARAVAGSQVTLREVRQMVWEMRAPELDTLDLVGALTTAARQAIGGRDVALEVAVHGNRRRLSHEIELAALRIGREAAINAVRHAAPSCITIVLSFEPTTLKVSIADDGRGFAVADNDGTRTHDHWGILGMRERAQSVGGSCTIESAVDDGTLVTVVLPIDQPTNSSTLRLPMRAMQQQ